MNLPVPAEIAQVKANATVVIENAQSIIIDDSTSFQKAGDILRTLSSGRKTLKSEKEKFTKPARDIIAQAKDLFGDLEKELQNQEGHLKVRMATYERKVDDDRRAAAAKLEARVEKGTMRLDTAVKKAAELETVDTASAGVTKSVKKRVDIKMAELEPSYIIELVTSRENLRYALAVEIRKDALGNKTLGVDPRIEKGVSVVEESAFSVR